MAVVISKVSGLYNEQWGSRLVKESRQHKAKYAKGLIYWLFRRGLKESWWKEGDIILDCMAGVGSGGVAASDLGLRWIGVELEAKFATIARANFRHNAATVAFMGGPMPVILRGDARQVPLRSVGDSGQGSGDEWHATGIVGPHRSGPESGPQSVVISPPYGNNQDVRPGKLVDRIAEHKEEGKAGVDLRWDYGQLEGNIGNRRITAVTFSPPYGNQVDHMGGEVKGIERDSLDWKYGSSEGQLGNLQVQAAVYSPPFSEPEERHKYVLQEGSVAETMRRSYTTVQNDTEDNIANHSPRIDRYWVEMAKVYCECARVLASDSVMVLVVKDFTRHKQVIPVCDMTVQCVEACGFVCFERVHCLQTEEYYEQRGRVVEKVEAQHKGFFRRLQEKKTGVAIDYEECLCFRRV